MKILLIDDETNPIEVYIDNIIDLGHTIVQVTKLDNLKDIIDKERTFNWIILDIMIAPGDFLSLEKSDGGLISGILLLDFLDTSLPGVPISVLTNVLDPTILDPIKSRVQGRCFKKFIDIDPNDDSSLNKLFTIGEN